MEKRFFLLTNEPTGKSPIFAKDEPAVPFKWFVQNEPVLLKGFTGNTFPTAEDAKLDAAIRHCTDMRPLGCVVLNEEIFFAESETAFEAFIFEHLRGKFLVYIYDKDSNVWRLVAARETEMSAVLSAFTISTIIDTEEGCNLFGCRYDWAEIWFVPEKEGVPAEEKVGYIDCAQKPARYCRVERSLK